MPGISRQFFEAKVGAEVTSSGRRYRITQILSFDSVLAEDLGTGKAERLRIETLTQTVRSVEEQRAPERDLLQYSDEEWAEGQRRLEILKPILAKSVRSRTEMESLAADAGVHVVTLYRWLKVYLMSGHVSSLVPAKPGRKLGTRLLGDEVEAVITSVIEERFLSSERATAQDVVDEVRLRCRRLKIRAPNHNSVRLRIADVPRATALRKRGRKDLARDLYQPIRGPFPGADHAYSVVQIDHTPANVIVVDEISRLVIGRPYLTLAIDVKTRMVVGIYLSLDPPSAVSVGLCLSQAICPKREYVVKLGVTGDWPVWGVMGKVHCDNAKEFRSTMLSRACEEYNIGLEYRPGRTPHFGGHIERLMGEAAKIFRAIPGKTFSNVSERKGYNSEQKAVMTLKELEAYLVDYILNIYHLKIHSQINMTPLAAWERSLLGTESEPGIGVPPLPVDPQRVQLDFMPFEERTCQRYGYQIDNVTYYDSVLDRYINALDQESNRKQKFLIRRDPRDISVTYFLDPEDNRYNAIPYRNTSHPPVSLWELRAATAKLREEGIKDVDEDRLFESIERLRMRVDDAAKATKAARRSAARRPPGARSTTGKTPVRQVPVPSTTLDESVHEAPLNPVLQLEDDPFAEPITAFEVNLTR